MLVLIALQTENTSSVIASEIISSSDADSLTAEELVVQVC